MSISRTLNASTRTLRILNISDNDRLDLSFEDQPEPNVSLFGAWSTDAPYGDWFDSDLTMTFCEDVVDDDNPDQVFTYVRTVVLPPHLANDLFVTVGRALKHMESLYSPNGEGV